MCASCCSQRSRSSANRIDGREVRLDVPENIPFALVDHTLIEQAVAKLLANAGSHAPSRSPIEVDAEYKDEQPDHFGERSRARDFRRNRRSGYLKNFIAATAAKPAGSALDYRLRADSSKRMAANSPRRIATAAARVSPSACRFA